MNSAVDDKASLVSVTNDALAFVVSRRVEILIAFFISVIAFFLFVSEFFMQSHGQRFPWVPLQDQVYAGRWFTPVVFWLNYGANIPVLGPLTSIFVYVISTVLVLQLWRFLDVGYKLVVLTCVASTFPMFTAVLYYNYASLQWPMSILLGLIGLIFASSAGIGSVTLGAIFVMFAMACNQTVLSTLCVVFVGIVLRRFIDAPVVLSFVRWPTVRPLLAIGLSIAIGAAFYRLSLDVLSVPVSHATSVGIGGPGYLDRVVKVVTASFTHLWLTQPDFLIGTKYLLAAAILGGVLVQAARTIIENRKSPGGILLGIVFLSLLYVLLVVSGKAMFFVSDNNSFYTYRYNLGLAYFHMFFACALLSTYRSRIIVSAGLIICTVISVRFIQVDLVRQAVLHRGQTHDLAIANRILYRIESLPNLDLAKQYTLVRIGEYPAFRQKSFKSRGRSFEHRGADHMDRGFLTETWAPAAVMDFLGTEINFASAGYNPSFRQDIARGREIVKAQGRLRWPDDSSVFIEGDYIYVYMR